MPWSYARHALVGRTSCLGGRASCLGLTHVMPWSYARHALVGRTSCLGGRASCPVGPRPGLVATARADARAMKYSGISTSFFYRLNWVRFWNTSSSHVLSSTGQCAFEETWNLEKKFVGD
jgi:hypothetical protein